MSDWWDTLRAFVSSGADVLGGAAERQQARRGEEISEGLGTLGQMVSGENVGLGETLGAVSQVGGPDIPGEYDISMFMAPQVGLMKAFLPGASKAARKAIRKEVVSPTTRLFKRGSPVRRAQAEGLQGGVVYEELEKVSIPGAGGVEKPSGLRPDVDIVSPSPVKAAKRSVEIRKLEAASPEWGPVLRSHEFNHVEFGNLPKGTQGTVVKDTLSGELPIHHGIAQRKDLYGALTDRGLANENYAYWKTDYLNGTMEIAAKKGNKQAQGALKFFVDKLGATRGMTKHIPPSRTYRESLGAFVGDPDIRTMWPKP